MKFITNLLVTAIAVYVISKLLTPYVVIESFGTAIIFAFVLAFLNAIVKPLIIILTLPITIITLGLFLLVVNVLVILLADHFVSGINIDGFFWALIFGFLLAVVSSLLQSLLTPGMTGDLSSIIFKTTVVFASGAFPGTLRGMRCLFITLNSRNSQNGIQS